MLKKIVIGLVVLVAAFLGFAATRPSEFRLERSTNMAASPATVYEQVADFKKWDWSPWSKLDPAMEKKIEGAEQGVGATYWWKGNDQVGEGRQTITAAKPGEQIVIKLEFIAPFAATNTTTFDFKPDASGTKVVWSMDGHNDLIGKVMHIFMDMDKMVGADFEKGLAAMKAQAETAEKAKLEQAAAAAAAQAVDAAKADEAAPEGATATP